LLSLIEGIFLTKLKKERNGGNAKKNFVTDKSGKVSFSSAKKGQAWSVDLIVALGLFSIGIVVFLIYSIDFTDHNRDVYENLFYDAEFMSNILLSEGYPVDWDQGNVVQLGILSEGKINGSKLDEFHNIIGNGDYESTKILFNTKYNYYFFFSEEMVLHEGGVPVDGLGQPGFDINNITEDNLIKITRFSIYNDKPVSVYLYVFD